MFATPGPNNAMLTASGGEPLTLAQAKASPDWQAWQVAMKEELDSLMKLGVLRLVPEREVPPNTKFLKTKMVWKYKVGMPGVPARY